MRGDVALNGTVTSYPQYPEAAANGCRVTKGHDHLTVILPYRGDTDVRAGGSDSTTALTGHVRTGSGHATIIDAAWRTSSGTSGTTLRSSADPIVPQK